MGLIVQQNSEAIISGEIYTFQSGGRWELTCDLFGSIVKIEQKVNGTNNWITTGIIDTPIVEKLFLRDQAYRFIFEEPVKVYMTKYTQHSTNITYQTTTSVANLQELRSLEPSSQNLSVNVLGHTVSGAGGGLFRADTSDTTTPDDNGLVIVTTGGKRWKRVLDNDTVTPEFFGAVGDGIVDDTTAIQNAINTLKPVQLNQKVYIVGDLQILSGTVIDGQASGRIYGGVISSKAVLRRKSGCFTVIDLKNARGFTLKNFAVDGVNRTCHGVVATTSTCNQGVIENISIQQCIVGLGGITQTGYYGTMNSTHLNNVIVTRCSENGIRNLIDCHLVHIVSADNYGNGINLQTGHNSNHFTNVRLEWNQGFNLNMFGCEDNVFVGGLIDRSNKAGISLTDVEDVTFNSVLVRRCAKNNANVEGERSNILIKGLCKNIIFNGIILKKGQDDGGTGTVTPMYNIEWGSGSNVPQNVILTNSDLSDFVTAAEFGTRPTLVIVKDNFGLTTYDPGSLVDGEAVPVDMFGDCTDPNIDHSTIVQAAIDYAVTVGKGISFVGGRVYNMNAVQLRIKSPNTWTSEAGSNPWFVYGNGCIIQNTTAVSSDTPSLFYSGLNPAIGGSATSGEFSAGVHINDIIFRSKNQFGVGYKHIRAGYLSINNCEFVNHEVGVKLAGTGGISTINCKFQPKTSGIGFQCAKLRYDSYSVNYTAESYGAGGWNDGVYVERCNFTGGTIGFYYDGSDSESVVTIHNCIATSQTSNAFWFRTPSHNISIDSCWFEYQNSPTCRIIEFSSLSNPELNISFESPGTARISNCYFSNRDQIEWVVWSTHRRLIFENNTVQFLATGDAPTQYVGVIWSNRNSSGNFTTAKTLTPTRTSKITSEGRISFLNTDLTVPHVSGVGTVESHLNMYYMTDGTKKFILRPSVQNSPTGSTEYTMHEYTLVYSPQWPCRGSQWLNATTIVTAVGHTGISADFDTPFLGYVWSGNPVTLKHGFDGDDLTVRPLNIISNNNLLGVDFTRFYNQREFGEVTMYNNTNQ